MAIGTVGLAVAAILISGLALLPAESTVPGSRVESDSYTSPVTIARCITTNINRKRPELLVRHRPGDVEDGSFYLILSTRQQAEATYGVIRVEQREAGSHLTTWLPERSLASAPAEIAQKLIAGC